MQWRNLFAFGLVVMLAVAGGIALAPFVRGFVIWCVVLLLLVLAAAALSLIFEYGGEWFVRRALFRRDR